MYPEDEEPLGTTAQSPFAGLLNLIQVGAGVYRTVHPTGPQAVPPPVVVRPPGAGRFPMWAVVVGVVAVLGLVVALVWKSK